MAKKPAKKNAKAAKSSGPGSLLAWILAPIIGILALPMVLLLAVGYLNFAGCLPYAIDLWRSGGICDFETLFLIITNPFTLLVMFSAAAVGWIVLFAAPPVVAAYVAVTSEMRDKQLKAR